MVGAELQRYRLGCRGRVSEVPRGTRGPPASVRLHDRSLVILREPDTCFTARLTAQDASRLRKPAGSVANLLRPLGADVVGQRGDIREDDVEVLRSRALVHGFRGGSLWFIRGHPGPGKSCWTLVNGSSTMSPLMAAVSMKDGA